MGITKCAATIIGIRVPGNKISHNEATSKNLCRCSPQASTNFAFCDDCGMDTKRAYNNTVPNDGVLLVEEDDGNLWIHGYPAVGEWREDKYIYIGCFVSMTQRAYSAEGSDPVKRSYEPWALNAKKFEDDMKEHGLWNEGEFGIWTVMPMR